MLDKLVDLIIHWDVIEGSDNIISFRNKSIDGQSIQSIVSNEVTEWSAVVSKRHCYGCWFESWKKSNMITVTVLLAISREVTVIAGVWKASHFESWDNTIAFNAIFL
jgi:hypothetical protein